MRTLLSYWGGKQRMTPNLLPLLPAHKVYCEPFAGGASLFWAKPAANHSNEYRECLNDLWGDLIGFYKVVQDPTTFEQFLEILRYHLYSRELHSDYKQTLSDDPVMRAVQIYVLIEQSFANKYASGWGFGINGPNHANEFSNKTDQLLCNRDHILSRLRGVYLDSIDVLLCLDRWDTSQTFFYVDPPYIDADQGYKHKYTTDEYTKLCKKLSEIEGKFMLSSYPNDTANSYGWYSYDFVAQMSAANGKGRTAENCSRIERFYTNYRADRQVNIED